MEVLGLSFSVKECQLVSISAQDQFEAKWKDYQWLKSNAGISFSTSESTSFDRLYFVYKLSEREYVKWEVVISIFEY